MMRRWRLCKDGSQPEFIEQIVVANYIRQRYPSILWTATAGGLRTSYNQAKRMKAMGLNRGVPDILIFEKSGDKIGLAIEMKREKGGQLSDNQKEWIEGLKKRNWVAVCCEGSKEAIKIIDDYFSKEGGKI